MKKGDIIVIFTLIIIFCFSFVYINKSFITTEDKYISVQVNGEEINPIRTSFGLNILEVDNDGVRVIEASCPDKLDVKFGKINKVGQAIICMPNRLVIQIKSRQNNDLDVVN